MEHIIFGPIDLVYNYRKPIQKKGDIRYTEYFLQETYFGPNVKYDDVKDKVKLSIHKSYENGIKMYTTKQYTYHGFQQDLEYISHYLSNGICQIPSS